MEKIILAAFIALGVTACFASLANAAAALINTPGHSGDINLLLAHIIALGISH
ncbi:MAG TPA: hypothetical protein VFG12_01105 [Rhodopila sp.]|jgi:hypothetical protein|nr:hypothetical protein [Rhodopila sp.]